MLESDRYFDSQPDQKALALQLYASVKHLPILSPHGHVNPALFSQPVSAGLVPTGWRDC